MRQAKLFFLLVLSILILYTITGFYFLPLASYEGDLTRIGKLPEIQFGWTKPQPAIAPALLQQSSWSEADVLVIGDSYSKPHLWQSVLVSHGLKVHTEDWINVQAVCADFQSWLSSLKFKGKYVILENAERGVEGNLNKSLECKNMRYRNYAYPQLAPPDTLPDRARTDYSGQLSVGIMTRLHMLEYEYLGSKPAFKTWQVSKEVRLERLANGCELFSHPRCRDVLFFNEDRMNDFDDSMYKKMSTLETRLPGLVVIWAVVPDKSTAYLNPNKLFWQQAKEHFLAPDLLSTFREAIQDKTVDLYRANDTHLSTLGFLIMGQELSRFIDK